MSFGVSTNELRNSARLFSMEEIKSFGSTLVFAPHPDDESLACGGLIALLRSLNNHVHVVFVSDGSMSHPGSVKFPADVLASLREREALAALALLNVSADCTFFMKLKDGDLPQSIDRRFKAAVKMVAERIQAILPDTIIVPWRRDTHPDHRSCWQMVIAALPELHHKMLVLEYPLWLWERGKTEDLPKNDEVAVRSVDISEWLHVKEKAINKHQSQVTHMIDDDANGFWLSPEVIAHFLVKEEVYLENKTLL